MDSASGSLQSSSGGDEEYDSHHQHEFIPPFPNFFNNNINIIPPSQIISSGSIPQLPFHHPHNYHNLQLQQQQQPTFFDFSSHNNYNLIQPNLNPPDSSSSFVNLDHMLRPTTNTTLRSEPTFNNLPSPSSPPHGSTSSKIQPSFRAGSASVPAEAQAQPRPSIPNNNDNEPRSSGSHPKNTKKRTRASRRAPTTVLTTDTSNFRAMVQEFTGIPAPPFSATGSSYSRRFDLFGSSIRSTTTHLEPTGSGLGSGLYPLRQKVQPFTSSTTPPSLNNNVIVDSAASMSNQIQQLAGVTKENQTVSNIQQQEEGFLVSLQNLSGQGNSSHSHSHSQMVSASSSEMHNDGIKWRGISTTTGTGRPNNASSSNINNCKLLNYSISGSSSKFHPDKEIMANISRGENTVDSWICPSD